MDSIPFLSGLADFFSFDVDWISAFEVALIFSVGIFAVGAILRAVFGRNSSLTRSISSTLNILLIYLTAILLYVFLPELRSMLGWLPFVTLTEDQIFIWPIRDLTAADLYPALLQLALLAFLVNTLETFLPEGKKFITWYGYRIVTGLAGLGLYVLICHLIYTYVPEIFGSWARTIILGFWGFILVTALLKLLFSAILTVFNPIIGGLYAFFFANPFGAQFSKAILTTVFTLLVAACLDHFGLSRIAFAEISLVSYLPACVIFSVALYLFGKLL